MESRPLNLTPLLLIVGLLALALAGLSVADMFVPRPYDGVVPRSDVGDQVLVRAVIPGSAAAKAGLVAGDEILGIGRVALIDSRHAARLLNRFRIGEDVVYLVRRPRGVQEITLELGRRRIGGGTYIYACLLGFSFFLVGFFVLVRQPLLRASQVFFLLCNLFLLFLVCRLRPASYSGIDSLILSLGTVAFLLLPPALLHFYLLFPRPAWLHSAERRQDLLGGRLARGWRRGWPIVYVLPPLVFGASLLVSRSRGEDAKLIGGAPAASWWLLALFLILGLMALRANSRYLKDPRERRGMALVLLGSFFGLIPFLITTVVFAAFQHSRAFFLVGILPLALVPLTFAYAIVRFQLLDIQVILRRSLLYTVTTALVTGLYAAGIATFNAFFKNSRLAETGFFPIFLALAIVLLFDPLRRRVQDWINRFFFVGRSRLRRAMVDLGEAVAAQVDLQAVVEELVERLPQILDLRFAALYLLRGYRLERVAGPEDLPDRLPVLPDLQHYLQRRGRLVRVDLLGTLALRSTEVAQLVKKLSGVGVEVLGDLASRRRHLGLVLLSGKRGQIPLESDELDLLQQLLQQASLALETSLLLDERTQKAELEREMEIAATIQDQLLPDELLFGEGWDVAGTCRPARIVGGDFFTQLPPTDDDHEAVVFGDVCGKSVSGALMMMAAHEAVHALALTRSDPVDIFNLANRRLYQIGRRNFVALGYFSRCDDCCSLRYLIAGQPAPLLRRRNGEVFELPLPRHRIPIGALATADYQHLSVTLEPGDTVLGYSDGVTDTRSPTGELFGEQRLMEAVAIGPAEPRLMVNHILDAVDNFSRGAMQYDDLTLVVVGRSLETTE